MKKHFDVIVLALTSALFFALPAMAESNLSGRWVFNSDLSDNAKKALPIKAVKKIKRNIGDVYRDETGRNGDTSQVAEYERKLARLKKEEGQEVVWLGKGVVPGYVMYEGDLKIVQKPQRLQLNYSLGVARKLYLDGSSAPVSVSGYANTRQNPFTGSNMAVVTGWEAGKLVVESTMQNGNRIVETYERTEDNQRLKVEFEVTADVWDNRTIRFVRYYDYQKAPKAKIVEL